MNKKIIVIVVLSFFNLLFIMLWLSAENDVVTKNYFLEQYKNLTMMCSEGWEDTLEDWNETINDLYECKGFDRYEPFYVDSQELNATWVKE